MILGEEILRGIYSSDIENSNENTIDSKKWLNDLATEVVEEEGGVENSKKWWNNISNEIHGWIS